MRRRCHLCRKHNLNGAPQGRERESKRRRKRGQMHLQLLLLRSLMQKWGQAQQQLPPIAFPPVFRSLLIVHSSRAFCRIRRKGRRRRPFGMFDRRPSGWVAFCIYELYPKMHTRALFIAWTEDDDDGFPPPSVPMY